MAIKTLLMFTSFILSCGGFLLENTTPSPAYNGPLMTDRHYNFLMELLIDEKKSRSQLETYVSQLHQELQQMKVDVSNKCNCDHHVLNHEDNRTKLLEKKVDDLQISYNSLNQKYTRLQERQLKAENISIQLDLQVDSLNHWRNESDIKVSLTRNKIDKLEQKIQTTDYSLIPFHRMRMLENKIF